MESLVRCPSATCGAVFEVAARHMGRNVYCLECGGRMTAKPLDVAQPSPHRRSDDGRQAAAVVKRLPFVGLLDNVRSLWNVGSIFRTADACGVERLLLTGITGTPPRPEIARTALGAEEVVSWMYREDSMRALEEIRAAGYAPIAVEASPRAVPIESIEWRAPVCLVVGNEVAGVSGDLLDACPDHVFIPMHGVKDSYNVAVAFGIVAHAVATALA